MAPASMKKVKTPSTSRLGQQLLSAVEHVNNVVPLMKAARQGAGYGTRAEALLFLKMFFTRALDAGDIKLDSPLAGMVL